jgi:HlyD family secretion protein
MNTMIARIRNSFDAVVRRLKRYGWKKNAIGGVVILAVIFGIAMLLGSNEEPAAVETATRQVQVKSIAELSSDQPTLSLVGVVQSKSEATVRAEKSGQVVSVNRSLGDSVAAGTIVASIENASESAAVLSAQGSVEAAQASLAKISGGTRSEQKAILQATVETAETGYASARSSAVNTILSAYSAVDNAIRGTGDAMFSNPDSVNPYFNITNPDSQLTTTINNSRLAMTALIDRQESVSRTISVNSDLEAELNNAEGDVRAARTFYDQILRALNAAIPSASVSSADIAAFQASAVAARASLNSTLSAIAAAKENLAAKEQGITIAKKNQEQGITGGQPEDVAGAQAGLKQAQGALAAARANLEKTYIRAPISGTINSFSLKRGDYVQMTAPVLTVANNGALEVIAYVTENDAKDIAAGSKVTIEDSISGVVTRVAPALDPVTKKIEVRIGVSGNAAALVNGQSVTIAVTRVNARISSKISNITVPISAIKIGSSKTVVFTVDADNKLVAHDVVVGTLLGDRVVITEGATTDMEIVTDARGLREGQVVTTE